MARFDHSGKTATPAGPNIHTPVVMLLSVIPGFGAVAYLASRPLRHKLLVRLLLDQVAWKLLRLYARMRLGRLLAPPWQEPRRHSGRLHNSGKLIHDSNAVIHWKARVIHRPPGRVAWRLA